MTYSDISKCFGAVRTDTRIMNAIIKKFGVAQLREWQRIMGQLLLIYAETD